MEAPLIVIANSGGTSICETRPDPFVYTHINVGTGVDCTIREMVETMKEAFGFEGNIVWDISKPDGAPGKLMDVSRIEKLGWKASASLKEGLENTYQWFLENLNCFRK